MQEITLQKPRDKDEDVCARCGIPARIGCHHTKPEEEDEEELKTEKPCVICGRGTSIGVIKGKTMVMCECGYKITPENYEALQKCPDCNHPLRLNNKGIPVMVECLNCDYEEKMNEFISKVKMD